MSTFKSEGAESWISGHDTVTGIDGNFRLTDVPRCEVRLSIFGDGVMEKHFDITDLRPENGLRFSVELRCHIRLVCDSKSAKPDYALVLAANDDQLSIYTFENGGWSASQSISISGQGTTHAFAVGDSAQTIVLLQDGKEITRLPLNLLPGEVTEVRY